MTAQLDLFGAPQPAPPAASRPAPRRAAELIPTPPTVPWARLLAAHPDVATRVMVQCSALYTGLVLESLALGPDGQHLLMADNAIRDIQPDPGRTGRYVYLTPRAAIALHARHPMIRIGGARIRASIGSPTPGSLHRSSCHCRRLRSGPRSRDGRPDAPSRRAVRSGMSRRPPATSWPAGALPRGMPQAIAARYVGLSESQFDLMWRRGAAPQPIKLTERRQVWLREDLDGWLDEKAGRARDGATPQPDDPGVAIWEAAIHGHG